MQMKEEDQTIIKQLDKDIRLSNSSEIVRNDSLKEMFNCKYFNVHMHISYLAREDHEEVIQYLVDRLKQETISNLDLYLP